MKILKFLDYLASNYQNIFKRKLFLNQKINILKIIHNYPHKEDFKYMNLIIYMIIKGSLNTGNEQEKLKVLLNYEKIEEYKEDKIQFEFEEQKKIKSKRTGLYLINGKKIY